MRNITYCVLAVILLTACKNEAPISEYLAIATAEKTYNDKPSKEHATALLDEIGKVIKENKADKTKVLALSTQGLEIAIKPQMNIVCMKMRDADTVFSRLSDLGWKASVTRAQKCLRIVVMPHVTKDVVDEFIPDLEKVCKDLKE